MSPQFDSLPVQAPPVFGFRGFVRRPDPVQILFFQSSVEYVERCLSELSRVRFRVGSDVATTPEQFADRLRSQTFDLIVAGSSNSTWQGTDVLDLLHELKMDVPLIFLVRGLKLETTADLMLKGAADCVDVENLGHLPVAVHRALAEKTLRDQRDHAEKELRHSQAQYRALTGNLSYGICRCLPDGRFLKVNDAMMTMLGYSSEEEVLDQGVVRGTLVDPAKRAQLLGQPGAEALADPVEIEWKRRDQSVLKLRLSGREVRGETGALEAYEIIAEDITRQRELEDHLRRQAASDSLTGLANYRRLVDVLDSEIKRSKRTNREFAILFFDLDGLKRINDRYGHMVGSDALCRLADVLASYSRDIDTAARFGGDEFALILPETGAEAAGVVVQRIRESIANDGKRPELSVSVGIAVHPHDGDTIESLLRQADSALYSMKHERIASAKAAQ